MYAWMCVHACVCMHVSAHVCVCVCVHVCVCVSCTCGACEVYVWSWVHLSLHGCMEARVQPLVFFSVTLHIIFQEMVSHWTWWSPVWLGWKPLESSRLWFTSTGVINTFTSGFSVGGGDLNSGPHRPTSTLSTEPDSLALKTILGKIDRV